MSLIEATPADWATVPEHLHAGIRAWVDEGIMPGRFLQAVICNDLRAAVDAGDRSTVAQLPDIIRFFTWSCPAACWGSPRALESWKRALFEMRESA